MTREAHTTPESGGETLVSEPSVPSAPATRLAIGDRIGERYEVRGMLGEGGMGRVYHAFDRSLGVEVALKVMRGAGDDTALRDEVRTAQRVTHPNVCRIYDLEEADGLRLVKMEYVPGRTLSRRIAEGKLPIAEAVSIARSIARGLAASHDAGVVHLDLKPGNVMLGDGRVVILDFGLAEQAASGSDGMSTGAGTPGYMAPEQLAGADVDRTTDLYALGCVLYEMLAGEPVFGGTPIELAARHASIEAPDVRKKRPEVPRWLARATQLLLAKPRARRSEGLARLMGRGRIRLVVYALSVLTLAAVAVAVVSLALPHGRPFVSFYDRVEAIGKGALDRARARAATDPPASIAMARPWARTPMWPIVRGITEAAVARGVPWVYAVHKPADIRMDPHGTRATVADANRTLWELDLATHRQRRVGRGIARYLPDGRIVIADGNTIAIEGTAGVHLPAAVTILELAGAIAFAGDADQALWRVDLASGTYERVPLPAGEKVNAIDPSPDGSRLVIADRALHLYLLAAAAGAPLVRTRFSTEWSTTLPWSASGRLVAAVDPSTRELVAFDAANPDAKPEIVVPPAPDQILTGFRGELLIFTEQSVTWRATPQHRYVEWSEKVGNSAASGDALALRSGDTDAIALTLPAGTRVILHSGISGGGAVAVSSAYVVASGGGRVVAWRLESMLPSYDASTNAASGRWAGVGSTSLFTFDEDKVWHIDPATHATREVLSPDQLAFLGPSLVPDHTLVFGMHDKTWIVGADGPATVVPAKFDQGILLDRDHALVADETRAGILDATVRKLVVLSEHDAKVSNVLVSGDWIAVSREDRTIERFRDRKPVDTHAFPQDWQHWALASDGTVALEQASVISTWSTDGAVRTVGTMTLPVDALLSRDHWFYGVTEQAAYAFSADDPGVLHDAADVIGRHVAPDVPLMRFGGELGVASVRDLVAQVAWPLHGGDIAIECKQVSPDGKRLYACRGSHVTGWFLWNRPGLDGPDATAKYLDELTNATLDPLSGEVVWQ